MRLEIKTVTSAPMPTPDEIIDFYETHYDLLGHWLLRPGVKVMLGNRKNRVCRFCNKRSPEVSFKNVAHAIPEALGNKSIESAYECDLCNKKFGEGIEDHLGNWSKPMRTFAHIRGKNGVPTLKKGGSAPGWRIEYGDAGLSITAYEADPFHELDEINKKITFTLKRDPYIPIAVLKAFTKIGLTLLPEEEVKNFSHLMAWIQEADHSRCFIKESPVIHSFRTGPITGDIITAAILRRKPHVTGYAYAYLVLGYGNEMFQITLLSVQHDTAMNGQSIKINPLPFPGSANSADLSEVNVTLLDLTGREFVRGEVVPITTGYETMTREKSRALDI